MFNSLFMVFLELTGKLVSSRMLTACLLLLREDPGKCIPLDKHELMTN